MAKRRVSDDDRSVREGVQSCYSLERGRTSKHFETETTHFRFNALSYGQPVEIAQQRCTVLSSSWSEDETRSRVLKGFCSGRVIKLWGTHEEWVAEVKAGQYARSHKSFSCFFCKVLAKRLADRETVSEINQACNKNNRSSFWKFCSTWEYTKSRNLNRRSL